MLSQHQIQGCSRFCEEALSERTAYGFLDFNYFRLKTLARLPGRGYVRSILLYKRLNRSLAVTKAGLFECCFI